MPDKSHLADRASSSDPAGTNAGVLGESLRIVGGLEKTHTLPEVGSPFLPGKLNVAAARDVIVHSNDEERRGGRSTRMRTVFS